MGFGAISEDGPGSEQLLEANVNASSDEEMDKANGYACEAPYCLCASSPGKDSCSGDSGGPMVQGNLQVGIVSWGAGCVRPGFPVVRIYSCERLHRLD